MGGVQTKRVSTYGKSCPLPRNILHTCEVPRVIRGSDRTRIAVIDEGLPKLVTHPYQSKGYSRLPNLPCGRSGSRKERYGLSGNRPLNYLAKSILVNVGGLDRDAKGAVHQ
jgi:hypothetical protein